MNTFEWNGLRVGERVVVHGLETAGGAIPTPGVVVFVEVRPRSRGGNNVGVRLVDGTEEVVLWPARSQVVRQA